MSDKKSFLNPNASPYFRISKLSSNNGTKSKQCSFGDSNPSEGNLQRLENHEYSKQKEDYGLQRLENFDLFPESFSNLVISGKF
jgi:hypothetical protein